MYSTVAELKREGFRIQSIDANERPSLCEKYGIWALPTFVYVIDGKVIRQKAGYMEKDRLRQMWRKPFNWFS